MFKSLKLYKFHSVMLAVLLCVTCLLQNPMMVHAADTNTLSVTKVLVASDINWANGNPTFIYQLSTIEGSSVNDNCYHIVLEFTPEYVNAHTLENGTVALTSVFTNLPPDEYSLTETDTLRYQTTNVTNVVNGEIYDSYWVNGPDGYYEVEKFEVEFNLNKGNGAATYDGVKTNWADASHTACVVNHIDIVP